MSTESSRATRGADNVQAHAHQAGAGVATAKEPAAATVSDRFMQISVGQIDPSPTNFRRNFDPDALQELADSILIKGVVEPIIVRPKLSSVARNKTEQSAAEMLSIAGEPRYEIVAGERRWRASKLAKVPTIPAIVRDYSDKVALEIQIIENDQREDLSPMERAAGFRMMLDRLGYSAEQIATKLHKSKSFVYSHLKLAELPKVAVESLEKGTEAGGISRSVAELIGRIPDAKQREKAAKEIIKGDYRGAPMNFRVAQEHIAQNFMRELKGAEFALDDATLVPAAGSCTACPMRSGNTPEEYQGKRPDICLQPSCFAQKLTAHHDRALESYRAKGHTVLTAAQTKEVFPHGGNYVAYNSPYVLLASTCYEDARARTYAQIVGADYKAIIARTPDGITHQLALKSDVRKLVERVKPQGAASGKASAAGTSNTSTVSTPKPDPKLAIFRGAMTAALARLIEKSGAVKVVPVDLLRFIVSDALDMGIGDEEEVARGRGIEFKSGESEKALDDFVARADTAQLVSLYAEIQFRETFSHYGSGLNDTHQRLLKIFGVDFEAIRLGVERQRAEWRKKLKTATTKDVIKLEVDPARLLEGGDISESYSGKKIADGKPVAEPFEHEDELFVSVGGESGKYEEAVRLVSRASYKGKTYKYGEKNEAFYEGLRVTYQGAEHVLTGPRLRCVPKGLKPAAAKKKATPASKKPARGGAKR